MDISKTAKSGAAMALGAKGGMAGRGRSKARPSAQARAAARVRWQEDRKSDGTKKVWTVSEWSIDDLRDQRVEFKFPSGNAIVSGTGTFLVSENPEGMMRIDIRVNQQGGNWAERVVTDFHLPQEAVDRIVQHNDPTVAEFKCFV